MIAAADLLKTTGESMPTDLGLPSFTELARGGSDVQRWNLLNPTASRSGRTSKPALVLPWTDHRGHRLRAHVRRADPSLLDRRYVVPGYRQLRPFGYARKLRHFFGSTSLGHHRR